MATWDILQVYALTLHLSCIINHHPLVWKGLVIDSVSSKRVEDQNVPMELGREIKIMEKIDTDRCI